MHSLIRQTFTASRQSAGFVPHLYKLTERGVTMLLTADQIAWVDEARVTGDVCDRRGGTMGAGEFWQV